MNTDKISIKDLLEHLDEQGLIITDWELIETALYEIGLFLGYPIWEQEE